MIINQVEENIKVSPLTKVSARLTSCLEIDLVKQIHDYPTSLHVNPSRIKENHI